MKSLILVLLCVVIVNARWSINYGMKQGGEHEPDWLEYSVFYQIYPSSFKDSDGDGRGDLRGITDNLDHLAELGVTGAWLSPIFDSPMKDGGYDISDFKKVNPIFGTNEDLDELFAKAKELGLKIILDFVPNHTSDQHDWFIRSAKREAKYIDYYVWRDCEAVNNTIITYPNNWIAVFHTPAWTYNEERGQCYLHQFTPEQPDLNYRNKEVYDEMIETLKYWLEKGADGFRIDAINHMFEVEGLPDEFYVDEDGDRNSYDNLIHNHTMNLDESYEFIYEVRRMMDKFVEDSGSKEPKMMMTEAYASIPEQVRWYGKDENNLGAHWPFNFALIVDLNNESKANDFSAAVNSWLDEMPSYAKPNWVLGNHDRPRVGYRYGEDRHESLAIMTMMLPGLNVVYYGEEILMTNNMNISFEDSDDPQARQTNETVYLLYSRDPVRTPFQWDDTEWAGFSNTTEKTWLPVHKDYITQNLKAQKEAEKSTFKLYQDMIKLRKTNHALQMGDFTAKAVSDTVYGFTRQVVGEKAGVSVFINLGGATTVNLKDLIDYKYTDNTVAKVLLVNNNSTLAVNSVIADPTKIPLGMYDAVVLEVSGIEELTTTSTTTQGASNAVLSVTLIVASIAASIIALM